MMNRILLGALFLSVATTSIVSSMSTAELFSQVIEAGPTQGIDERHEALFEGFKSPAEQCFIELFGTAGEAFVRTESVATALTFSRDGKKLASGLENGAIIIWDVASKSQNIILQGHTDEITSMKFSADGKFLASGSKDKTARVWDVASGALRASIENFTYYITAVTVSERVIKGERQREFILATDRFSNALHDFSPDEKMQASDSLGHNYVSLSHSESDELISLQGHTDSVISVVFSFDGTMIASSAKDQSIRLWPVFFYTYPDLSFFEWIVLYWVVIKKFDSEIFHDNWKVVYKNWQKKVEQQRAR